MAETNKIVEISEQIKALKDITFGEIFTQQLKASKIPFPEKFEHYIEKLIENANFTSASSFSIHSANPEEDGWHISISGQPFSYFELDDQVHKFDADGNLDLVIPKKEGEPFFWAKFLWAPYDETLPEGYIKPEDSQYFNSILNYFEFPDKNSDNAQKGHVEVGCLIANSTDIFFISYGSVAGNLNSGYTISGLLPNYTYTIANKEYIADASGQITISTEKMFEIINTFDHKISSLDVTAKYNGRLKDYITRSKDIQFYSSGEYSPANVNILKPNSYSNMYTNVMHIPLEVSFLGKTTTLQPGESINIAPDFNNLEELKTIKANAIDKLVIKNSFTYPWNKEFTISSLTNILDKDYLINLINQSSLTVYGMNIKFLGKTYTNPSSAIRAITKTDTVSPSKDFLESINENTTEIHATIEDTFEYPWNKTIPTSSYNEILDRDYLVTNNSISPNGFNSTNNTYRLYVNNNNLLNYKFNNENIEINGSELNLPVDKVYAYLKNKANNQIDFAIDINSDYYNKTISVSDIVTSTDISNYLQRNSDNTFTNSAKIKKVKAYTIDKNDSVVYNLPEEEAFDANKILPIDVRFNKKINDGGDVSIGIADDDCINNVFLELPLTTVSANTMPYYYFESYNVSYRNKPLIKSYGLDSYPALKQYIIDNYEVVSPHGNKYALHADDSLNHTLVVDDKINNELLFSSSLTVSLVRKDDTNNEYFRKDNIAFESFSLLGNVNLASSISSALTALGKNYDATKNGFNFTKLENLYYDGMALDLDSAKDITDGSSKFVGMKTLYFMHESNSQPEELINSNEKITAINSLKVYFSSNGSSSHIVVNYNTESVSNKVVDKEVQQSGISGILYGYDLNNLMDFL